MSVLRRLARPLLAAAFIEAGLSALRHPGSTVDGARPVIERVAGPLRLPADPELFVRVDGAVLAGAGTLLAIGKMPRLAALALVVGTAPTTFSTEVAFWREKDPESRRARRRAFLARAGLIGGALLAAVDTGGRPSLAWRGRRAVRHVHRSALEAGGEALRTAEQARTKARAKSQQVGKDAERMARQAQRRVEQVQHRAEQVRHRAEQVQHRAGKARSTAPSNASDRTAGTSSPA